MMSFIFQIGMISLYAVSGVTFRLAFNKFYSPEFYKLLLSNSVGCLFMGIFMTESIVPKKSKLRPALTSGFCGVLTSFSSWIHAFTKSNRTRAVSEILCGLSMPFVSYLVGAELAKLVHTPKMGKNIRIALAVSLALAPIPIFIFTPEIFNAITLLLAITGCLVRVLLTKVLNKDIFPFGTMLANVSACLILALTSNHMSVKDGLCGGLSTVSLFVHEAISMQRTDQFGKMVLYVVVSVGMCTGISILVDSLAS